MTVLAVVLLVWGSFVVLAIALAAAAGRADAVRPAESVQVPAEPVERPRPIEAGTPLHRFRRGSTPRERLPA